MASKNNRTEKTDSAKDAGGEAKPNGAALPIASFGEEIRKGAIKLQKVEFQGPLPPPAVLAQYEDTHSGFADRIISMAEIQAAHRQSLERDQSESRRRLVEFYGDDLRGRRDQLRRGQYLGAGVCALTTICGACIAILTEATAGQIAGGLVSVSGLGGIVVALMTGRMRSEGADENEG